MFADNQLIPLKDINSDSQERLELYNWFQQLYSNYLGRPLERGESNVFNTAIKIILWKVYGKTFKNICWYRYSFASKTRERKLLERQGKNTDNIEASFFTEYKDIPNKLLNVYSSLNGTKAKDVDYDYIMYDTYDYIDKLIGFKLSDIFYVSLFKYFEKTNDNNALRLAKLIKYGTDNDRHIWMLRYGMSFEDIELLDKYIVDINSEEIKFDDSIKQLQDESKVSIKRFLN